jgi:hypothetical protein
MFLTIGFIVGFAAGWYINDKVENLADKLNPYQLVQKEINYYHDECRR